jgi:hypothetical protein
VGLRCIVIVVRRPLAVTRRGRQDSEIRPRDASLY